MARFHIPYDVQCLIIEVVDFETLKAASLLSSAHNRVTAHRMWRSCSIKAPYEDTLAVFNDCITHMRGGRRLKVVRELRVQILQALGEDGSEEVTNAMAALASIFQGAENLTYLEVIAHAHHTAIAEAMSAKPIAPRLLSFRTNLNCGNSLAGFWDGREHLETLDLMHYEDCTLPLLSRPLPNLKTVILANSARSHVIRGNPVTNVIIRKLRDIDVMTVADDLVHSSDTITHINLNLDPASDPAFTTAMYTEILARIPEVQFVRTAHRLTCTGEKLERVVKALKSLTKMVEFGLETYVDKSPPELFAQWRGNCPDLRKFTCRLHNTATRKSYNLVFDRVTGEDDEWKLTRTMG